MYRSVLKLCLGLLFLFAAVGVSNAREGGLIDSKLLTPGNEQKAIALIDKKIKAALCADGKTTCIYTGCGVLRRGRLADLEEK